MKTKSNLLLLLFLINTVFLVAQSGSDLAKAYYTRAESEYASNNYSSAIKNLDKAVENLNGSSFAKIEYLYTQCYYKKNNHVEAQKHLKKYFDLKPDNNSTMYVEMINLTLEITEKAEEEREAELARQKRERDKKLAAQKLKSKKNNIAAVMLPEVKRIFHDFSSLEEGRAYLVTYRKSLTSSKQEKAYFIFYGNKFIIYTIPSISVYEKLNKNTISFDGYKANVGTDYLISAKLKPEYGDKRITYFKKGIHFSNVFLGGFGDELMWTSGTQNNEFDKTLYYYYYFNTMHCDIKLKDKFQKDYYNPYIETGTITKTVDYDFINDAEMEKKLRGAGFKNKTSKNIDSPNLPKITLKTDDNMKMLYPQKQVTYKFHDKVKNEYYVNGSEYSGTYLYYRPKTSTSHYGFIQLDISFSDKDLFDAITGLDNSYILSSTYFESIWKTFSEDVGNGTSRYFTSNEYTTPYWAIGKISGGNRVTLESLYGTYKEETPKQLIEEEGTNYEGPDETYMIVEEMPSYPGGKTAMVEYLQQNLIYPQSAVNEGVSGKVWVSFIVNENGEVGSVEIIKSVSSELDNEARRLVRNMPNWNPGKQRGKYVKVKQSLPINFVLE